MTDLQSLKQRVERATGPDWQIDLDISAALVWPPEWKALKRPDGHYDFRDNETADAALSVHKEWTASIDAALTLVERLLPGWNVYLRRYSDGWYALIQEPSYAVQYPASAQFANADLAVIHALLTALLSKGSEHHER